jgi:hypothetical protein
MAEREVSADLEPTALYEIRLQRTPPEPLRREFPTATVYTTRTETVLFRRVEEPAELDELIDQILSRGVVLTEVHEVRPPSTSTMRSLGSSSEGGLLDDHHV